MATTEDEHRYGIGAVAKLTGLTDHTIRVWERRYGAVIAGRTSSGRREYTAADVEKLALLKSLTDQGIAISQIADANITELRDRAASLSEIPAAPLPGRIRVAVLGEFLPGLLAAHPRDPAPVEVVVADNHRGRFSADAERNDVDVVVYETPTLDGDAREQLLALMQRAGTARAVVVYSFGRSRDVEAARDARIVPLRAPLDAGELLAGIQRAYAAQAPGGRRLPPDARVEPPAEWEFDGPVAPRRFTPGQLARLAATSTSVDCECPHHLAQLVGDLSAFEIYSANCANRDSDDEALHRYLHRTTAQARALLERALEKVARAEGLDY